MYCIENNQECKDGDLILMDVWLPLCKNYSAVCPTDSSKWSLRSVKEYTMPSNNVKRGQPLNVDARNLWKYHEELEHYDQ
jgi:hypothetical protein